MNEITGKSKMRNCCSILNRYFKVLLAILLLTLIVQLAMFKKSMFSSQEYSANLATFRDGHLIENPSQESPILQKWRLKLHGHYQERKPLDSIYFLKIHKTGSTTLQGIIMRYGDTRNLTFGLHYGLASLGYPKPFQKSFVRRFKDNTSRLDIICHHLRHSDEVFEVLKPKVKAVTLIRNPTYSFISAFKYYQAWSRRCFGTGNIDAFLSEPDRYTRAINYSRACQNKQLFDLGMQPNNSRNIVEVINKIHEIDRTFHLVMISEYFKESLILLKHLMNWSFHDIIYFSKNVQNKKTDQVDKTHPRAYKIIKELNSGDEFMYQYYNRTFWKIIDIFGRDKMDRELAEFNVLQDEMEAVCIEDEVEGRDKNVEPQYKAVYLTNRVNAYILTEEGKNNETCRQMLMYEVQYTNHLRKKMRETIM
ncbi:unnamed protein product [Owenia fusiformis]|uniref:Uncharacterized protein n=1 Tax=Owenia fusiformis TaxID=6347 RepID=A0A8J1UDN8_OWEFU|nr:unnamed protein product [Owenia fusiformis]